MVRWCSLKYFVKIHKLQTKLRGFKTRGVVNFRTRCKQPYWTYSLH